MERRHLFVALATGCVVVLGCTAKYVRPTRDLKVALTPERIERGRYLVENVAACGACHDGRDSGNLLDPPNPDLKLAGGTMLEDGPLAVYVPNITNDPETGIGRWTDDELIRGIRDGVRPDGSFMFPLMPFSAYRHLSDEDVEAIVAYLRSVPPVKQTRPRVEPKAPLPMKVALSLGAAMHEPVGSVPPPEGSDPVKRGEYLARAGHCTECHSLGSRGPRPEDERFMAGGDQPMSLPGVGKVWPSNLTPAKETGLGRYSDEQILASLSSGMRLDGKPMAPPMSLFVPYLTLMTPEDKAALVAWLKALPPVENPVPARELTPEYRKLLGE